MPYCGDTSLVKNEQDERTVQCLKCRAWTCPDCVDSRRRRLMAEALGGEPNTLLTLTARRSPGSDPAKTAQALSHAWRCLRLRAIRHYKLKSFEFMAVFEATAAGTPHLHILARVAWLDQAWLSSQMQELLDSPIVDIRRIDNKGRAVAYVAKYVGKNPHHFGKSKRYWKSKCYERRPDRLAKKDRPKGGNGERCQEPWTRIVSHWRTWGWSVTIERPGFARARNCSVIPRGP